MRFPSTMPGPTIGRGKLNRATASPRRETTLQRRQCRHRRGRTRSAVRDGELHWR